MGLRAVQPLSLDGYVDVQGTPTAGGVATWVDADTIEDLGVVDISTGAIAVTITPASVVSRGIAIEAPASYQTDYIIATKGGTPQASISYNGEFRAGTGSVTFPSISFYNNSSTGFYGGAGIIQISANGTNIGSVGTGGFNLNVASLSALFIEQNGVNDNTLVVNTLTPEVSVGASFIVSPAITTHNGLVINLPAGSTGDALQVKLNGTTNTYIDETGALFVLPNGGNTSLTVKEGTGVADIVQFKDSANSTYYAMDRNGTNYMGRGLYVKSVAAAGAFGASASFGLFVQGYSNTGSGTVYLEAQELSGTGNIIQAKHLTYGDVFKLSNFGTITSSPVNASVNALSMSMPASSTGRLWAFTAASTYAPSGGYVVNWDFDLMSSNALFYIRKPPSHRAGLQISSTFIGLDGSEDLLLEIYPGQNLIVQDYNGNDALVVHAANGTTITPTSTTAVGLTVNNPTLTTEDIVRLQVAGSTVTRFNESGYLGIGADPTYHLDVAGETSLVGRTVVGTTGVSATSALYVYTAETTYRSLYVQQGAGATATAEAVLIHADQAAYGNSGSAAMLRIRRASNDVFTVARHGGTTISPDSTTAVGLILSGPSGGSVDAFQVKVNGSGTPTTVIDSTGRLGVNMTTPSLNLAAAEIAPFTTSSIGLQIEPPSTYTGNALVLNMISSGATANALAVTTPGGLAQTVIDANGYIGILTNAPTTELDIVGDTIRLRLSATPASAAATGNAGDIQWDSNYIYVCVAANTWKRATLATW